MTTPPRPTLMRRTVSASLRFRFIVVAAAVGMMVFGTVALPAMRIDVFPEFAPPRVEIQTLCMGLTTADVESLVTVPLEQALNGVDGLDDLRSKSVPQLSSIELIFKPGTDLLEARQLVAERLDTVISSLPTWAAPPVMLPPVSATGRAVQIGMSSKDHSLIAMSMMAYWTIRARILRVPGVANVALWGERLQLMTVQVKPGKMRQQNVSLDTVMEATADSVDSGLLRFSNGSVIGAGGFVDAPNQRISVQSVLPIVTPADMAKVPVEQRGGHTVRIGDVAHVAETHQPLIGDAVIGDGPGLLLVVEKLPWADSAKVTRDVEKVIKDLQPGMQGVQFDTHIFQQARFIDTAIHNLREALVLGFLLVVVILFLFLFEWRVALISLVTIPLSLMATMLVLYWRGDTVNTMTLAGLVIALGAVVDDAIIDVENILRRLRQERAAGSNRSTASIILDASLEVRSPIVYATLIIVAAAMPVFLLSGLTGAFFRPLAVSYTLAILASMAVALTVTPALCLILLHKAPMRRGSPVVRWLHRYYTAALARILARSRYVYVGSAVLVVAGVVVTPALGQSLFPTFKERDFLIHWIAAPSTSAAEEQRTTIQVSKELRAVPGVRSFGSHIGQAFLGEEIAGVNFGEGWVSVDDDADLEETLGADPQGHRQVPRALPGRADLPQRAHRGGAHRRQGTHRGPDLRRGPARHQGQGGRGPEGARGRPRADRPAHRPPGRRAADRGAGEPPRGGEVRPQARRRTARRVHVDRGRGGGGHLPPGQGLRRRGVEHARDAQRRRRHRRPPVGHPVGSQDPAQRRGPGPGAADPQRDRAAGRLAAHRRGRRRLGTGPRVGGGRGPGPARVGVLPARLPRRAPR